MGVINEQPAAASELETISIEPPASQAPPSRDVYNRTADEQERNSQQRRGCRAAFRQMACAPSTVSQKVMCALFWTAIGITAIALFAVIFPRFVDNVVNPFIRVLTTRLTPKQIAGIIFGAILLLPMTIVIGVVAFVWLAGIVFNFWVALAIVMAASTVGMSLQYWMARYVFHDRVVRRLEKDKKSGTAVVLRSVEYMGQWKVVALLRLGPAPYNILNYALGVCPSIKFFPMIICSVICELLPRALQVFFGRSLETLADLLRGRSTNAGVAVYNVVVLLIGVVFIVVTVILSKRTLRRVEEQEKAREAEAAAALQAEAAAAAEAGLPLPSSEGPTESLSSFPGKVQGKLAATTAATDSNDTSVAAPERRPGSSSSSDIQVIVDEEVAPRPGLSADDRTNSTSSSFRIGTEQQQQPLAAVTRSNTDLSSSAPSLSSRWSSSSSLRWLLAGDRSSSFKA